MSTDVFAERVRNIWDLNQGQQNRGGAVARGALAPPILDLRTWTFHADNWLLCSLSHQPP